MVDLDDERNLVGVLPAHEAEYPVRRRHGVAATLDGEFDDVLRVEVRRIRRERRCSGVLDALIDRQDRHVTRAAQPSGVENNCWSERSTWGDRSLCAKMRSTKSGPGRCSCSLAIVFDWYPSSDSASAPNRLWMSTINS